MKTTLPVADAPEAARPKADAVKARAWDAQRLAERNVPRLRKLGLHDEADLLVKLALRTRREAQNLELTNGAH